MTSLSLGRLYWRGLVTLTACIMLGIFTNCDAFGKETGYDLNGNGIIGDAEDMLLQSTLEKKIQYVLNGLGYWAPHQVENGFWGDDIQLTSLWVDSEGTVHAEVSMFKYLDGTGYPAKNEPKKYEFHLKSDGILVVRDLNNSARPIAGLLVGEHAFISVSSIEDLNGNLEFADNEDLEIALNFIYKILDLPKKADSIEKFSSTTKYSVETIEALGPFNVPGPYNLRTQITKTTTYPIMSDGTQTTVTDHYVYTLKTDGTLYVQYLGWEKVIHNTSDGKDVVTTYKNNTPPQIVTDNGTRPPLTEEERDIPGYSGSIGNTPTAPGTPTPPSTPVPLSVPMQQPAVQPPVPPSTPAPLNVQTQQQVMQKQQVIQQQQTQMKAATGGLPGTSPTYSTTNKTNLYDPTKR